MLTPAFVASVKVSKRTDYPDDKVPGLVLRVTPNGVKTWCLRYRIQGQARRLTLGSHESLTIKQARAEAKKKLYAVATGHDPSADKRTAAATSGRTVEALVHAYQQHTEPILRTWQRNHWRFRRHILPHFKHLAVTDVTRRDVRAVVEAIAHKGNPTEANRVLSLLSSLFKYGVRRDWLESNPASEIELAETGPSRARVLTEEEIRAFWQFCDHEPPAVSLFLKIRLLTAQRCGELLSLNWTDVESKGDQFIAFTFAPESTKNGRAHRVPVPPFVSDLLKALPRLDHRVFPGRANGRGKRYYEDAAGRVADRMTTLAKLQNPTAEVDIRGHDLRRTAATYMAQAGVPPADISRVLNHAEGGPKATQVYQRYTFDKEKRVALETLARVIQGILEDKPQSDVVPFARR